ncbi:molybdopterin-dependent oxidoreductase [Nannocystaceae bacterium ST9]
MSQHERVEVEFQLDGGARSLAVGADDTALTILREQCGRTGTKLGCGHGVCGACAVSIDGESVKTCLLPATALHRRSVTTVAGLATGDRLHPIQRAFMAADALQCGYCTPGFLVRASIFVDEWRRERGDVAPDRDTIAAALAGHLCRCGAYEQIFVAVASACRGEHDRSDPIVPRHDARAKVEGRAIYTVDVALAGQLEGRMLRSPHAHAKVVTLDLERARRRPGVRAVIDLRGADAMVRYAGQEIAAVAALDRHTAEAALRDIEVRYEVLPAAIGMDRARAGDAPLVYPRRAERRIAPNASEGPLAPLGWAGNVRGPFFFFSVRPGKARKAIERARAGAGTLVEGVWQTQVQCHTALEPNAAVARWDDDGGLSVWVSTQAVHRMSHDIATRFDLPREQVRVFADYVGGGFGGKADLAPSTRAAIELAKLAGAPVRVVLDRREELTVGGLRPAQELELAIASDPAGALAGIRLSAWGDAGVAVGNVTSSMFRIMYARAPRDLSDYDVVTHGPPGKPFRGPGGPPAFWALEQAIDQMAIARAIDPVALRRAWDDNPVRTRLYDWVETLDAWTQRGPIAADRGRYRRGVGLAAGGWFYFIQPATKVEVALGPEGLIASTASQDMGNGTRTAIANAVARNFGVSPHAVEIKIGDSRLVEGPFSGGSRTTASVVPAAEDGAVRLRDELTKQVAKSLGLQQARGESSGIVHAGGVLGWPEAFAAASECSVIGKRIKDVGGFFLPFRIEGLSVGRFLAGSVQVVELEVDTRLGKIRPLRTWAGIGCGRLIAPELARSQLQGGIIQGLSYALYEDRRLDPRTGQLLTGSLDDYRIAGIGDIPEIHTHFDEAGFEDVRSGTVGLGELVTLAPAACVGNAVMHATGWRPMALPVRPDRLIEAMKGMKETTR